MYVLNYWHNVTDYGEWKKIFDSDPLGRRASGVRRVSIERPTDDESQVIGELEFDTLGEAETFAGRLQEVWQGSASSTVSNAGLRITEVLVQEDYRRESSQRAA
jgi:hypothetical protein